MSLKLLPFAEKIAVVVAGGCLAGGINSLSSIDAHLIELKGDVSKLNEVTKIQIENLDKRVEQLEVPGRRK